MTWRKIRLVWFVFLMPLGLGALILQMIRGETSLWQGAILIALGSVIIFRLVKYVSRMQPEEVVAEEASRREMWLIFLAAIILQIIAVFLWILYSGIDNPNLHPVPYITLGILTPAVIFAGYRSMRRTRQAKRAADERIAREQTQH